MLEEYAVKLVSGFETRMLMTESYKNKFYPDAVRVADLKPQRRRSRHAADEDAD